MDNTNQLIDIMTQFVEEIGIPVSFNKVPLQKEFVPGICIENGGLIIDRLSLKYPGDILHEAGHLAVATPDERQKLDGVLETNTDKSAGEEMMAIAWSYAAAIHLKIDPLIVFHDNGYKGGGSFIVNNFSEGRYIGLPMLQWIGLALDEKNAIEQMKPPYPAMLKWIRS